jgi:putative ABC transport system ATP-binding protein
MSTTVEVQDLSYAFGAGLLRRPVLVNLNLAVEAGEVVLLTGPSGSGKTTLMALIGALRALQEGSCIVLGRELGGARDRDRVAIRRRIGFVFQDHRLLGFLTAAQNVAMSLEVDPAGSERDRMRRAVAMLEAVGLAGYAGARPDELSGGQRQRVAIARALVRNPGLILADEPTAALDRQSGAEITRILCELARQRSAAVLIVTHDVRILDMGDRVLAMEDGRIGAVSASDRELPPLRRARGFGPLEDVVEMSPLVKGRAS